jgi:hypothetical protein
MVQFNSFLFWFGLFITLYSLQKKMEEDALASNSKF